MERFSLPSRMEAEVGTSAETLQMSEEFPAAESLVSSPTKPYRRGIQMPMAVWRLFRFTVLMCMQAVTLLLSADSRAAESPQSASRMEQRTPGIPVRTELFSRLLLRRISSMLGATSQLSVDWRGILSQRSTRRHPRQQHSMRTPTVRCIQ